MKRKLFIWGVALLACLVVWAIILLSVFEVVW